MTTVNIGLPDDQAAALKAKASAPGINVEDWFSTVNRSEDLALQESTYLGPTRPTMRSAGAAVCGRL